MMLLGPARLASAWGFGWTTPVRLGSVVGPLSKPAVVLGPEEAALGLEADAEVLIEFIPPRGREECSSSIASAIIGVPYCQETTLVANA